MTGEHLDSHTLSMVGDSIEARQLIERLQHTPWTGEAFHASLRRGTDTLSIPVGFYEMEEFGAWSRVSRPFLILDRAVSGDFVVEVTARAYGQNVGRLLHLEIGESRESMVFDEIDKTIDLYFSVRVPTRVVYFTGIIARTDPANEDPRALGVGVSELRFRRLSEGWEDLGDLEPPVSVEEQNRLIGFHDPEVWGSWSKQDYAWVEIPEVASGRVSIRLGYQTHSASHGRELLIECGGTEARLPLYNERKDAEFELNVRENARVMRLSGWVTARVDGSADPRALGVGIGSVSVRQVTNRRVWFRALSKTQNRFASRLARPRAVRIRAEGTIFGVVMDFRSNSNTDVISAFVNAFRNNRMCTLIVLAERSTVANIFGDVLYLLSRVGSYDCRVIVIPIEVSMGVPDEVREIVDAWVEVSEGEYPVSAAVSRTAPLRIVGQHLYNAARPSDNDVVVPASLRPERIAGDEFGYRRSLRYGVEWDDLVHALNRACGILNKGVDAE